MSVPHFINRYGWVWTLLSGAAVAGMLWGGVTNTEIQSAKNNDAIASLQIDMAGVKQEVHDIHDALLGAKK